MSNSDEKDESMEMLDLEGDGMVSLAELAGLDFSEVAEQRQFAFPQGVYSWEIITDDTHEIPKVKKVGETGAVAFGLKCTNVLSIKEGGDFAGKPEDLLGKIHRETFFFKDLRSLGYIKAFLIDIGVAAKEGKLPVILASSVGTKFSAPIVHRPNKDNKDVVYVNINRGKIIPAIKKAA